MAESKSAENVKIIRQSVLDAFSNIAADDEKKRIDSTLELMKHLAVKNSENPEDEIPKELQYACGRLIRGLGSSRDTARKGYYAAFVSFLFQFPSFPMQKILELINKELEMGKFSSKGEEGEVCVGRMLSFGAIIRCGHFSKISSEDKIKILNEIIEASSRKSYLPQAVPLFLLPLVEVADQQLFNDVIWPSINTLVMKPWAEQTVDTLYLLLKIEKSFPKVIKKSNVKKLLGLPIVRMESLHEISSVLFNIKGNFMQHPVYEEICKELGASSNLAPEFWQCSVDLQLLGPKCSKTKGSLAIELFCLLIANVKNKEYIPQFLTQRFVCLLRQRLMRLPLYDAGAEELRNEANNALVVLVDALKLSQVTDNTRVQSLEKIVTSAQGDFGFDQITKSNVIHSIALSLKADGLVCAASLFRAVISGESHPCKGDEEESNDSLPTTWLNKDRIAAVNLLVTLATHPAATSDFQTEQTLVLLELAFFPPPGCSSLCPAAKEGLMRCIAVTSPSADPLSVMRSQLSHVVAFINSKVAKGQRPHKASKEVLEAWKNMMDAVSKLKNVLSLNAEKNSKSFSQKQLANVLLVLFMQLGVQLFLDSELAVDSLQELHLCLEKAGLTKDKISSKSQKNEPHWVEVVTDLFLSLLSQNSSMLRNIVNRVFSAMCPLMTENALLCLAQVVDCSSENNPLSVRSEANEEDSASDKEGEDVEEEKDDESDEPESEVEEEEEDSVSDRVRAAVRDALGDAGELTDVESVDLDDISEEEGQRLDQALSNAFSALRKTGGSKNNITKKQSKDNKDLLHFRVRVMDLIDTYMQSDQSLHLVCTLIPPLFGALEACLKDVTQKPLETRIRNSLRKLSGLKKFANVENVSVDVITSLLQSLIDKGDRTAAVFLDVSHEVCVVATFLVRCSQLLSNDELQTEICNIYTAALDNFFNKRDCLLPPTFFSLILKTTWQGNFSLWPIIAEAAFENTSVRPFRKSQALTLLRDFALNEKLLAQNLNEKSKLASKLSNWASHILVSQVDDSSQVKSRFNKELFQLLIVVHQHCKDNSDWCDLEKALAFYLQSPQAKQIGKDVKKTLHKLQRNLGVDITESVKEFEFVKPSLPKVNGCSSSKKVAKQQKRKVEHIVNKSSEQKQERRKAKELRLSALSEGFESNLSFSTAKFEHFD